MFVSLHCVLYTPHLVSELDEFVLKHHSSELSRSFGNRRKSPSSRHESNRLFTVKTKLSNNKSETKVSWLKTLLWSLKMH